MSPPRLLLALLAGSALCGPVLACAEEEPPPPMAADEDRLRLRGVQKRLFLKTRRHELDLVGGAYAPDVLDTAPTWGLYYTFHLSEEIALEGGYLWSRARSATTEAVQRQYFQDRVRFFDSSTYAYYQGDLVWTPIHGKLLLFAEGVVHFDMSLLAGVGATGNRLASGLTFNGGLCLKFFLTGWLSLRLDVRDYVHREEVLDYQAIANDLSVTAGLGIWFPFRS
jgi:outer membrane beta-barrel protein